MSSNFIAFIILIVIVVLACSQAASIYITLKKGQKLWKGVLLGFIPFIGHMIALFLKASDRFLIDELYDRNVISKEIHDKTIEMQLKTK